MITEFKLFESNDHNNAYLDQIFSVSGHKGATTLYMNDEILHYFLFTHRNKSNKFEKAYCDKRFEDNASEVVNKFFNGDVKYNSQTYNTCFQIGYGLNYRMRISISKGKYMSGKIGYYFTGSSGSHSMHEKGMIRASKQVNFKIIKLFFPDIKHDNNYRAFLKGELQFSELIDDMSTYNNLINKTEKIYAEYKKNNSINKFKI